MDYNNIISEVDDVESVVGVPSPMLQVIESDFEPQTRARSNTWPCPRPEGEEPSILLTSNNNLMLSPPIHLNHLNHHHLNDTSPHNHHHHQQHLHNEQDIGLSGPPGLSITNKKSTSRRNAWGNMSYADLITQAISSSPEKRLTLSQIYDWMVTNVPYFKDKGDSNSSAGWKNSIRHNLSLHNRFVRVQNEGTGKSSWWMLNPDAKPGKAARRRATSMETSKYEKKRGRIRKKIEAMRNGTTVLDTPSPSSSLSEGLDIFPESPQVLGSFQLSPSDFRPRASSNASSCGRLSPILGVVNETNLDLHDNLYNSYSSSQFGSSGGLSGGAASGGSGGSGSTLNDRFGTEQLAGNLANTMKLTDNNCFMPPPTGPPSNGPQSSTTNNSTNNNSSNNLDYNNTVFTNFQSAQSSSESGASGSGGGSFRRIMEPHYYDFVESKHHHHHHSAQQHPHQHHQQQQHILSSLPSNSSELDFSLEQLGHFDCDVDEVLQTELNLGGDILVNDFNFNSTTTGASGGAGGGQPSHHHQQQQQHRQNNGVSGGSTPPQQQQQQQSAVPQQVLPPLQQQQQQQQQQSSSLLISSPLNLLSSSSSSQQLLTPLLLPPLLSHHHHQQQQQQQQQQPPANSSGNSSTSNSSGGGNGGGGSYQHTQLGRQWVH